MEQTPERAPTFFLRAGAAAADSAILFVAFYAAAELSMALAGGADAIGNDLALERTFLRVTGLVVTALSAAYFTILTGKDGQTFGKKLAAIKVIRIDGGKVGYGQAFARWVGYQLCVGTLGAGFLMAAFKEHQRGLHDLVAGTRVVVAGGIKQWRKAALSVAGILTMACLSIAVIVLVAELVESFLR